jgi:hypothetical protein
LWLAATTAVPDAAIGPDAIEQATEVAAPIARVTVYSDRARVSRLGRVAVRPGVQALRVPDLPGATYMDTVRVGARGARVLRVETAPIDRERMTIDQVEALLVRAEQLGDQVAVIDGETRAVEHGLRVLGGLAPRPPVSETERVGKPPPLVATLWTKLLDLLDGRRAKLHKRALALAQQRRGLARELEGVQREIERHDLGGFTDRRVRVVAIIEAERAGHAEMELEYVVPGALWRPAYDLMFDGDTGQVTLKAAGLVTQATGEDWDDAAVSLSTAIPGQGIALPELLTWTLGEQREYVPAPFPRTPLPSVTRFAPPQARPVAAELERDAQRAVLTQRVEQLRAAVEALAANLGSDEATPQERPGMMMGAAQGRAAHAKARPRSMVARTPPPPPPAAAPMPEMAMQFEASMAADAGDVVTVAESTGRRASAQREEAVATTPLDLYSDEGAARARIADPTLPAALAGGLDFEYDAPTRVSIPSRAERLRVPLASRTYAATTFYEATPSLQPTAFLKATVENGTTLPILGGPANIFVGREFVGEGQLATTGPGGRIDLPLGADQDIRLVRTVVPATETQGVFNKEDVTTYTTTLEVANYKRREVIVRITDQLPKSDDEHIRVTLGAVEPAAEEKPDADGLLHWRVPLKAGATRTIRFTYTIRRPKDWRLYQ